MEGIDRIVAAMTANRGNYKSDASHARALGLSASVYSAIKGGNTEKQLSDEGWASIAAKLGVNIGATRQWQVVRTPTFRYITTQLAACQERSLSNIFCDVPDIGKTVAARQYALSNRNVIYIDCSQVKTKQRLVRHIAKEFGLSSAARYSDVYDSLVAHIRGAHRPLIILDEAGDLKYEAFLELKALWNATDGCCGWYQMGADALRVKMERGVEYAKVGYAEMRSRLGGGYDKITPAEQEDIKGFMLEQAAMVAKANAPAGADYLKITRKSEGSLRRVYTDIVKPANV